MTKGTINSRTPYKAKVGSRLRTTAADLNFLTTKAFADHLGVKEGTVDAWFNGRALPPVERMIHFCHQWGLSLGWIYEGKRDGLTHSMNIRLTAQADGMVVPKACRAVMPEDEPPPAAAWTDRVAEKTEGQKPVRRRSKASETY